MAVFSTSGSTPAGTGTGAAPDVITEVADQLDDTIRCRRCRHGITAGRFAIEVDGAHAHTFRNPAGWSFRMACFADAPGAAVSGTATYAHTWFAGYAWQFAHCSACGGHLGWWFVGGADAFAGLVLSRLL
ncbi:MAG TPA: cereblon family protein [Acidimicrobiales bacterium]|nr:cereblon family protein [Acidimicrobiales bacterium]